MLFVVIALSLVAFMSVGWSVQRFFARPGGTVEAGMRWLRLAVCTSAGVQLFDLMRQSSYSTLRLSLATVLYAAGLILFWSSIMVHRRRPPSLAYSRDLPEHLVVRGPYALVRHPFYTSYMCSWLGGYVASGEWTSLLVALVLFVFYERSTRLEERKFAASELREEYARYVSRTGRYLPNPAKLWRARAQGTAAPQPH